MPTPKSKSRSGKAEALCAQKPSSPSQKGGLIHHFLEYEGVKADEEIFDLYSVVVVYRHRAPVVPADVAGGWSVGAGGGVLGDSKKKIAIRGAVGAAECRLYYEVLGYGAVAIIQTDRRFIRGNEIGVTGI